MMVRPLKERGVDDVDSVRRRVRRLLGLSRVLPDDAAYIVERLDEVEARIVSMRELDEYGKEVG